MGIFTKKEASKSGNEAKMSESESMKLEAVRPVATGTENRNNASSGSSSGSSTTSGDQAHSRPVGTVPPKKTVSQVLGEVTWLLTQSPVHKQLFIGDLEWFIMPPLLIEQFRIFHGTQHPVGVALWAKVSEDTNERLKGGAFKLRPDEWKGGEIPWLIELIAPFGGHDEILADLSDAIFPTEAFSYHKVDEKGQRVVASYVPNLKN